ncbi:MAG: bacillithiol biosynthesis deacetylase BshB1 [Flavobacteriales bacterium]|nr:bacillithiol biosynthesis deacetylase BshB1 [Flavobacteriales bacterium]
MNLDILAFGAHPDDVELGCGGTIIKEVENGKKVGIIDLTLGELGTRGNVEKRKQESKKANKILGIEIRENMCFKDGFFENTEKNKIELIKKIRCYRPKIVLTNALSDRHPDHPRSSQLTIDACFLSGLSKINTNQEVYRPEAIYHYIQFNSITPDFVVDITNQIDKKIEAVKCYASQFYNPNSNEKETIISTKSFLDSVKYRAEDLGRQTKCMYAEAFIAHQLPKVNSLFDLK